MWRCRECGTVFDEPLQYNPDNIPELSYEDFDLWGDYENEDVCPDCYSMDIERVREEDDWDRDIC